MFENIFRKTQNGRYCLVSPEVLIYQENANISKIYNIILDGTTEKYYIVTETENLKIGPFKDKKSACRALRKMSKNDGVCLSPLISLTAIILISFGIGHSFVSKQTSSLPSNIPMVPMGMDTDGPGIGGLSLPSTTSSAKKTTNPDDIVAKKLDVIRNTVQSGKPLTEEMFVGIPSDLANQIKQAAIQVQRFQKPVKQGLGSHKEIKDTSTSSNTSNVNATENPASDLSAVTVNPELKKLEEKHEALKEITKDKDQTPISPTSTDYKDYNDFSKDYPDLSKVEKKGT